MPPDATLATLLVKPLEEFTDASTEYVPPSTEFQVSDTVPADTVGVLGIVSGRFAPPMNCWVNGVSAFIVATLVVPAVGLPKYQRPT